MRVSSPPSGLVLTYTYAPIRMDCHDLPILVSIVLCRACSCCGLRWYTRWNSTTDDAATRCQLDSGNDVISCFPNSSTVFAQDEWATFVCTSAPFILVLYVRGRDVLCLQGTAGSPSGRKQTSSTSTSSKPILDFRCRIRRT